MYHARLQAKALESAQFEIAEITGHEELSRPYWFEVLLVGPPGASLDEEALLTQVATIHFERDGKSVRVVHGAVRQVAAELHGDGGHSSWRLRILPRLSDLELSTTTEIAMDLSVPEIVEERLKRLGWKRGDDYAFRLGAEYPRREYVVQYKESHLAFVSRLMEHVGIGFFFEQREGGECLCALDENASFPTELIVPFRPRGERLDVYELRRVLTATTRKVLVKDYNYRTPRVELTGSSESGQLGESYEYGVHAKSPEEAAHLARVRSEETGWQGKVFDGRSARPEIFAGARLKLDGHPIDHKLVVVSVEHRLEQPTFLSSATGKGPTYENAFRAIDERTPYRPERRTPKPYVPGVLTGRVEAAQEGEYAEIDDQGRYRVRFGFDTSDRERGKASRPIRMAQPHAGQGYGFHFPLRDGVEVLLTCVEGDPDRPVIAGAVPNPITPSTVVDSNARRNVIRTGGGTEINIDDNDKGERLKITVPYGNTVFQLGAPNAPTPGVFLGTDKMVRVQSSDGMNFIDETQLTGRAPDLAMLGTTYALLDGGAHATVASGGQVTIRAPLIVEAAAGSHETSAPLIKEAAGGVHVTSAPLVSTHAGGAWVVASDGVAALSAGGIASVSAAVVSVQGSGMVTVSGPLVVATGATVNISGSGTVNIGGPTVNIDGGVVNVTGGPIKLNA